MSEREQARWERYACATLNGLLCLPGLLLLFFLCLAWTARLARGEGSGGVGDGRWEPVMAVSLGLLLLVARSLGHEWKWRTQWDHLPPSRGWEHLFFGMAAGVLALSPALHAGAALGGHFAFVAGWGEVLFNLLLVFFLSRPMERRMRRLWRVVWEARMDWGSAFCKEMAPLLRRVWPAGVLLLVLPGLAVFLAQGVWPLPPSPRWLSEGAAYLVFLALLQQAECSWSLLDSLRRLLLPGGEGFRLRSGAGEARLLVALFLPLPVLLLGTLPLLESQHFAWGGILLAPLLLGVGARSLWGKLLLEKGCLRSLPLGYYRLRAPDGRISWLRGQEEGRMPSRCWEPGAEMERVSRLRYAQGARAERGEEVCSGSGSATVAEPLFALLARLPLASRALQGWEASAWLSQSRVIPAPLRAQALERLITLEREEALCYLVEFPELSPYLCLESWTALLSTPEAAGRLEAMRLYADCAPEVAISPQKTETVCRI